MKSPKSTPDVAVEAAAPDVPPMPVPPHGGSFVLTEDHRLEHVPVPVSEAVEEAVEPPVKTAEESV